MKNSIKKLNKPIVIPTNKKTKGKKVFVAMSGGVDSSVAALILKQNGYDVIGAHIKSWDEGCEWKEERRYAVKNCAKLDIPFITLDLTKEYKKEVIEYMVKEYEAGRTPNPDVMCNKSIKFGAFLKKAVEMGADYIATGHYIRISRPRNSDKFPISPPSLKLRRTSNFQFPNKSKIQNFKLMQAKDKNKDQSYFLWTLNQEQLKYCLFPIGDCLKPEVRKIAEHYGLPSAKKKDSQGLCFVGKVKFDEFLGNLMRKQNDLKSRAPGHILSEEGKILGEHHGLCFYTIGQRGRLGIGGRKEEKETGPLYVAEKDYSANTLIAVTENSPRLFKKELAADSLNWINRGGVKSGGEFMCRIRYRQPLEKCRIKIINKEKIRVVFHKPQRAVAAGQSIVFYKGKEMIGGGVIC